MSDKEGFEFSPLESAIYKIIASKEGYIDVEKKIEVVDGQRTPVLLEMESEEGYKSSYIKGEVRSTKGKPIYEAKIVYKGKNEGEIKTDNEGKYKIIDLAPGEYQLSASHPNYKTGKMKLDIGEKEGITKDFHLERVSVDFKKLWELVKIFLKDWEGVEELEEYSLKDVQINPPVEFPVLMKDLRDGKYQIEKIDYKVIGK